MTDPGSEGNPADPPPPDEEYVEGYAAGYAEGLREALREMLSHAARGHTVQELRLLAQSRLARVPDDVDVKRRSMRAPPRRPSWGAILRPIMGPTPPESAPAATLEAGTTYLVREERPRRGPEMAARLAAHHPRLLCVSVNPPPFAKLPSGKLAVLRPAPPQPGRESVEDGLSLSEIAGRIREATESEGGAVTYLDAIEYLATEYDLGTTLKFVNWAVSQSLQTRSSCVASVDPGTWEPKDLRLLQRAFNIVL